MNNSIRLRAAALAVTYACVFFVANPRPARSDDAAAKTLYNKAVSLYAERTDLKNIVMALQTLGQAEMQAQGNDLKYDIFILEARSLYWQGQHTAGDDNKKTIHLQGKAKADLAGKLSKDYAEAPYYAGINLARWAEANGVIASIQHKGELIQYMKDSMDASRTTRDGKDADTVDGFGPDRVLGRMYYKLPAILGGSHSDSLKYLRDAVKNASNVVLSVLYLVDTLEHGSDSEKAEGRMMLDKLLLNDPNTYNIDRLPETLEEFQMARDYKAGKPLP